MAPAPQPVAPPVPTPDQPPARVQVRVQTEDFDVGAEYAALIGGRSDIGGIGCFVGTVRANASGPPLEALTLEHYPGMTERAIAGIVAEAERRWPCSAAP